MYLGVDDIVGGESKRIWALHELPLLSFRIVLQWPDPTVVTAIAT